MQASTRPAALRTTTACAIAFASLLAAQVAGAATTTWTDALGNSQWSSAGNWSAGLPGRKDTARFASPPAGSGSVHITGIERTGSLLFEAAYRLLGGTLEIETGVVEVASEVSAEIAARLTDPAGLLKLGAGTLRLSGTSTSAGDTVIEAGTLELAVADERLADLSAVSVRADAVLRLAAGVAQETLGSLAGAGVVEFANDEEGLTILSVGANQQTSSFSGELRETRGRGSLRKIGQGGLILRGRNTLSGGVSVVDGTLALQDGRIDLGGTQGGTAARVTVQGGVLALHAGVIAALPTAQSNAALALLGAELLIDGGTAVLHQDLRSIDGTITILDGALDGAGGAGSNGRTVHANGSVLVDGVNSSLRLAGGAGIDVTSGPGGAGGRGGSLDLDDATLSLAGGASLDLSGGIGGSGGNGATTGGAGGSGGNGGTVHFANAVDAAITGASVRLAGGNGGRGGTGQDSGGGVGGHAGSGGTFDIDESSHLRLDTAQVLAFGGTGGDGGFGPIRLANGNFARGGNGGNGGHISLRAATLALHNAVTLDVSGGAGASAPAGTSLPSMGGDGGDAGEIRLGAARAPGSLTLNLLAHGGSGGAVGARGGHGGSVVIQGAVLAAGPGSLIGLAGGSGAAGADTSLARGRGGAGGLGGVLDITDSTLQLRGTSLHLEGGRGGTGSRPLSGDSNGGRGGDGGELRMQNTRLTLLDSTLLLTGGQGGAASTPFAQERPGAAGLAGRITLTDSEMSLDGTSLLDLSGQAGLTRHHGNDGGRLGMTDGGLRLAGSAVLRASGGGVNTRNELPSQGFNGGHGGEFVLDGAGLHSVLGDAMLRLDGAQGGSGSFRGGNGGNGGLFSARVNTLKVANNALLDVSGGAGGLGAGQHAQGGHGGAGGRFVFAGLTSLSGAAILRGDGGQVPGNSGSALTSQAGAGGSLTVERGALTLSGNVRVSLRGGDAASSGRGGDGGTLVLLGGQTQLADDVRIDLSGGRSSLAFGPSGDRQVSGGSGGGIVVEDNTGADTRFSMTGGTIIVSGGQGASRDGIPVPLPRAGMLTVRGGTVALQRGLITGDAGASVSTAMGLVATDIEQSGGTLSFGHDVTLRNSQVTVSGGTMLGHTITLDDSHFMLTGGTLQVDNFFGDLDHSGGTLAALAGQDAIDVIGDYTQGHAATLAIALDSLTSFDRLTVKRGLTRLDGTLRIDLARGFDPAVGSVFAFLSSESTIIGSFTTLIGPALSGKRFVLQQDAHNRLTLAVTAVPLPSALWLAGSVCGLLALRRRAPGRGTRATG